MSRAQRVIDGLQQVAMRQGGALALFEQVLCGMAFDKGVVSEWVERVEVHGAEAPAELLAYLALESPGISAVEADVPARRIIQ